ncbi:MAG TPA: hypothetical protein VFL03_00325 [Candidatus Limnocylindrales bacterium]|nr:hypothetical protein [Candidatus Limnocylindrales bacterium]
MTRTTIARFGATFAVAGAILAACGGGASTSPGASVAAPSVAASESASASATTESPSASASESASASASPSGSPAARTVQMYAIEGGFQNAPIDPTPGTVLTFRNLGKEAHELVVIRRNDDATEKQTFDDLTKVSPADLLKFATVVGVLAADPGQEATGQIVLTEPGDYAAVDLLAKGTTTAPASPDPMAIPSGVPNLADGMFATFSVIEPAAS